MPDIDERDALNLKEDLSPLSAEDKLKQKRYALAEKVQGNSESKGLLNKQIPNLHLFGGK